MSTVAAAREDLFGDVLACDEVRPAAFIPGTPDRATLRSLSARGEALLRALAVIEDGARSEEPEQPLDHALSRIEAKIDLLAVVVAGLCTGDADDSAKALRWSARGACLAVETALAAGSTGQFRVKPADWLPSPLLLPATVLVCAAEADGGLRAWLRFEPIGSALQAALERHLFRVHRRSVAESRRPR